MLTTVADWQTLARRAAQQVGVPPNLFVALVRQESGGRPGAVSRAGAIGYTQLMPATARGLGVNPRDPWQNLLGGAKYLRQQLHTFGGSIPKALAAYNAGPGAVQKYHGVPPYAETQNYVKTILANAGHVGPVSAGNAAAPSVSSPSLGGGFGGASPDPGGGVDVSALLEALQKQQRTPAPSTLQAPSFAAGPTLPAGYQALTSGGGPAPRPDVGQLLSLVRTQGGGDTGAVSGAGAPSTASDAPGGTRTPGGGFKGSKVLELIYNDGGPGYGIKNGQVVNGGQVFSSVWGGHRNHVHVAAGPQTVVALGKLAQSMGLHVGENPHFGGVSPVHVPGSFHYKGEAVDVSGDPRKMAAFARRVEAYNRTHRL